MNKRKIKQFVEEHKKEVIFGTGLVATGIVAGVFGARHVEKMVKTHKKHIFTIACNSEAELEAWKSLVNTFRVFEVLADEYTITSRDEWVRNMGTDKVVGPGGTKSIVGAMLFCKED